LRILAPIALFVYARPDHTRRTVEALKENYLAAESDLYIFSDAARDRSTEAAVTEVRKYVSAITGFRSVKIVEREKNYGLAPSIIDGVTTLVNIHGKVIVLEDDLVTSKYFLQFMNDGLEMYQQDQEVISIHGYVYPVTAALPETFFICGADCWGWATWKRGWDLFEPDGSKLLNELMTQQREYTFDWDGTYGNIKMLQHQISGKVNSWAIRWHASAFLQNKLTLYPGVSLVNNIGGDALGTHTKSLTAFQGSVATAPLNVSRIPLQENNEARNAFVSFFGSIRQPLFRRIFKRLTTIFS
jgi:hypothetical protein